MNYRENFSSNVRKFRKERKISIQSLADILGVTNQAISLIELNKRSPSFEMLCAIADYFDVSLDSMIGRNISQSDSH